MHVVVEAFADIHRALRTGLGTASARVPSTMAVGLALSKSDVVAGLRCARLLWLSRHRPDEAATPDANALRRLQQGNEVGVVARERFPGGVRIPGGPADPERALRETCEALASDAPALFEACFEHDGVRVFVDVLERDPDHPGAWRLIEVKASTRLKTPRHLQDVAVQAFALRGSGVRLTAAFVLHIDRSFVAPDQGDLLALEDVTREIARIDVRGAVRDLRAVVARDEEPDVPIGSHCGNPYACPFKARCWSRYDPPTVFDVPKGIHPTRRKKLIARGRVRLRDLRDDDELSASERAAVKLVRDEEVRIDRTELRRRLDRLRFPLHFLDFEAIDFVVPRTPGTRPYQQLPFQFSCHVVPEDAVGEDGRIDADRIEHREYLHTTPDDPRPAFAQALVEALNDTGSIVAFHADYERLRMQELAEAVPQHAGALHAAIGRLWDQEPIFREVWRDHRFGARSSIKVVLPVLCPDLSYDGMPVASGTEAMAAWDAAVHGEDPDPAATFDALRAYCEQDTWAMVRIHERLTAEAS